MINGLRAQIVNPLSVGNIKTRRSGLNRKVFLGGNFFRLAEFRQICAHQRFSERWRDCINLKKKNPPWRVCFCYLRNTQFRAVAYRNWERMALSRVTHYPIYTNRVAKNDFARLPAFTTGSHCHG